MTSLLSIFWFIWAVRSVLFWIYLWQLEECRISRLIGYLRTEKGKKIVWNKENIIKLFLFVFIFDFKVLFFFLVFFLYFFEAVKTVIDLIRKNVKIPVFMKKSVFLFFLAIFVLFFFLFFLSRNLQEDAIWFSFWLLLVDVLIPLVVSAIIILCKKTPDPKS